MVLKSSNRAFSNTVREKKNVQQDSSAGKGTGHHNWGKDSFSLIVIVCPCVQRAYQAMAEADFPMSALSSCRYLGLRITLVCLPGIYGVGEELGFSSALHSGIWTLVCHGAALW